LVKKAIELKSILHLGWFAKLLTFNEKISLNAKLPSLTVKISLYKLMLKSANTLALD